MSTLGDATDVNPVIKFVPHTLHRVWHGYCTAEVGNPVGTYDLPCIASGTTGVTIQNITACIMTDVGTPHKFIST